MKNTKLFQYVVLGLFVFFLLVGAILFSTFRSSNSALTNISITVWGTLPENSFNSFSRNYFSDSDLKYTVNYTEKDPAIFDRDLIEALAGGVGPDAIVLPTDLILRYFNKIYPIPYTTLPETAFKDTFIQEGELYLNSSGALALPLMVDPLVMYWNRDIFNNAGVTKPPTDWAQVSSLVPKMTKLDKAQNIITSAIALGEYRNVNNSKSILSALFVQIGNPIVAFDSGSGTFKSILRDTSSADSSIALQFYTNFSNSSKSEYSWNRSLVNSLDFFTNGDSAIYLGFASEYMTIKNKNPNLNFDVALLPQAVGAKTYSTFGNMFGLAIMKNSANPAGTFTVLTSLSSAAAFSYWKDIFNLPSARKDSVPDISNSVSKTIFNRSAIISKGWYDPNSAKTSAIFQDMVESYTTGRETLDGVINTASERLDSLLNN
jgi:ABC-type glycerol-3-phosphate transport system substrate-binding protein